MKVPTNSIRHSLRQKPEDQKPIMYQEWANVLFLHWEYRVDKIQEMLPEGLHVDTYNNKAYIGIVPFFMKNARPRRLPNLHPLANFMELTMRTYVYDDEGIPGIWFISLDVNRTFASNTGRRIFNLPYTKATMRNDINKDDGAIDFLSLRKKASDDYILRYTYEPEGNVFYAEPDSLEFFLIERNIFFSYSQKNNQIYRTRVFHEPYPLKQCFVSEYDTRLFEQNHVKLPDTEPIYPLLSPAIKVNVYRPEKVNDKQ